MLKRATKVLVRGSFLFQASFILEPSSSKLLSSWKDLFMSLFLWAGRSPQYKCWTLEFQASVNCAETQIAILPLIQGILFFPTSDLFKLDKVTMVLQFRSFWQVHFLSTCLFGTSFSICPSFACFPNKLLLVSSLLMWCPCTRCHLLPEGNLIKRLNVENMYFLFHHVPTLIMAQREILCLVRLRIHMYFIFLLLLLSWQWGWITVDNALSQACK